MRKIFFYIGCLWGIGISAFAAEKNNAVLQGTQNQLYSSLPDTTVYSFDTVVVPLTIDDVTSYNIASARIELSYDSTVIRFAGVVQTGTVTDGAMIVVNDTAQVLKISIASGNPFIGGGVFFALKFVPRVMGDSSSLHFLLFDLNEPSAVTPTVIPTDGRIHVSSIGMPALVCDNTSFDFGTIISGAMPSVSAAVKNNGASSLVLTTWNAGNGVKDFFCDASSSITIQSGAEKNLTFTYQPHNVGTHSGVITYETNDPQKPLLQFSFKGTAVAKLQLSKKILVDAAHNSSIPIRDTTYGMTQLFSFLEKSGFTVSFTDTTIVPSGFDAVLIVSPQQSFTPNEIKQLQQFVNNGGLAVMLGNSSIEGSSNAVLNSLLNDPGWATGMTLGENTVTDSTNNYFGYPAFPVITHFADTAHPFLKKIDSLVLLNSSSVVVTGSAIPFATYTHPSIEVANATQAAIGLAEIGKGKVMLFGDATIWQNSNSQGTIGGIDLLDNLAFALNLFSVTENYSTKLPGSTPDEEYRLISIPYDLNDANVTTVLKDLGNPDPLVWRLFGRYNVALQKYLEFPEEGFTSFKRGEAYWLITRGKHNVNFGDATISPATEYFALKICPGYSMIGNPFPYAVSWVQSRKPDSVQNVLWKFNGKGFEPESLILEPFRGYFVKNLSADSTTIYINPQEVVQEGFPKTNAEKIFADNEWNVNISAATRNASDDVNIAGVSPNAKIDFDMCDISEPPTSPAEYVTVRFTHSSWEHHPGNYAFDFHPVTDEGTYWDFEVTASTAQSNVSLSFNPDGNIPAGFSFYVVDKFTERVEQISGATTFNFTMNKAETHRSFRLVAGKNEYVEKNTDGIPLVPVNFVVQQNFPNPFNPSTTIRYMLGHSGNVAVSVYNVLGQKVKTLNNEFQSIGTHSVEWNGTDNAGKAVSTDVYFYRVTVNFNGEQIFSKTQKMILMK